MSFDTGGRMQNVALVVLSVAVLALAGYTVLDVAAPAADPLPTVRFVVEDRATEIQDDTEYGTSFRHTGVVQALGDSIGSYLAIFRVERVSGGDPEAPREEDSNWFVVPVERGSGTFRISGGYRSKANDYRTGDNWEVEKVQYAPVGYIRLDTIPQ